MDLSIIIVNWNTCTLLQNCLRSIENCGDSLSVQTIVVDNNSSDNSREMVARCFPRATLLNSGGNLGFAKGNNLGLTHAMAPLVLFLNPDTEIKAGALRRMVQFMHDHAAVGALGCKIRNVSGTIQRLGLQWFPSPLTEFLKFLAVSDQTYERLPGFFPCHDPETSGYVTKLFGACLMVRRSALEQVGSFDEQFFMYCEDVDLCYRLARAGWKLFYLSEAEILHLGASASSTVPGTFSVLMTCESFSKFMRKYHGKAGGAAYRTAAFLGAQARLLMLLILSLPGYVGGRGSQTTLKASRNKYFTITKWALGLKRPAIHG
jgi:N-acetylglucosaminyl-diphospho-decaprenol L-rhamnosyltransferase